MPVIAFTVNRRRQAEFSDEGGMHALLLIEYNWGLFNSQQRAEVLKALSGLLQRTLDPGARFVVSEILGEYFANEEALNVACQMRCSDAEGWRMFAPHAFGHFVETFEDVVVRRIAYEALTSMRSDPSNLVRTEVDIALATPAIMRFRGTAMK